MNPLRTSILVALATLSVLANEPALGAQIPVVGVPVPELAAFDTQMIQFAEANNITASSLSVMRNGAIVFHHVYGWQDRERTKPLAPDSLFRIASISKPFTAAAVRKLIEGGLLKLDARVFSMGKPGAGILDYAPFGVPDSRLSDITVEHLLQHQGGWDAGIAGDLTYSEVKIATAMGVSSPPGRENTVRYIMGQPLQFNPGSRYAYSNTGYLILGLIVEKVSGISFRDFVQSQLMSQDGFTLDDWGLGHTFADDCDPREPYYDDPTLVANVFYPGKGGTPMVEAPYGGFDYEARMGQGGIVTKGPVILRFLDRFQVAGGNVGLPRLAPGGWWIAQTGSQPGVNSYAVQRGDGINYVLLFDKRPSSGLDYSAQMAARLDALLSSGEIKKWPTNDVTKLTPHRPAISLGSNPAILTFPTEAGRYYRLQSSLDMLSWTNFREPFVGNGEMVVLTNSIPASGRRFFRLEVRQ